MVAVQRYLTALGEYACRLIAIDHGDVPSGYQMVSLMHQQTGHAPDLHNFFNKPPPSEGVLVDVADLEHAHSFLNGLSGVSNT